MHASTYTHDQTQAHPAVMEQRLNSQIPVLLQEQRATPGKSKAQHAHPEGQIYVAIRGLIVVEAAGARWIMPPGRLCWIPPGVIHGVSVYGRHHEGSANVMGGLTLHLAPNLCQQLPVTPMLLRVSALMQALLDHMQKWTPLLALDQAQHRLLLVFIDELCRAQPEALRLSMPRHPRLLQMASHIVEDPADDTGIEQWADQLAMSSRSLSRHFRAETGMSVIEWRQIARLQRGLELLTAGQPVTTVALSLGYDSVSSFISLFRKIIGTTPAKFAAATK